MICPPESLHDFLGGIGEGDSRFGAGCRTKKYVADSSVSWWVPTHWEIMSKGRYESVAGSSCAVLIL